MNFIIILPAELDIKASLYFMLIFIVIQVITLPAELDIKAILHFYANFYSDLSHYFASRA